MVFLKTHSKSNVFYTLSAFYISLIKHLLVSFLLPTLPPEEKPASKHPTLRPAFSTPPLLSAWVVRAAPTPLGPYLGAYPRQGAEGLMGLLVGRLAQLLQPGKSTPFFQDGSGTGTHIAGTIPQAQLPELSLHLWPCGVVGRGSGVRHYHILPVIRLVCEPCTPQECFP